MSTESYCDKVDLISASEAEVLQLQLNQNYLRNARNGRMGKAKQIAALAVSGGELPRTSTATQAKRLENFTRKAKTGKLAKGRQKKAQELFLNGGVAV